MKGELKMKISAIIYPIEDYELDALKDALICAMYKLAEPDEYGITTFVDDDETKLMITANNLTEEQSKTLEMIIDVLTTMLNGLEIDTIRI